MQRRTRSGWAYAFVGPAALAFALLAAWPIGRAVRLSLGGGHYAFAVGDGLLWLALANTIGFALAFAAVQVPLSLAAALLVGATPRPWGVPLLALFFSTHLVGAALGGVLFHAMLGGSPLLDSPAWAMPLLVGVSAYLGFGFGTIYCLAALRRIDRDLADAAAIDGAGRAGRLWHVTLPQLRPTLSLLFVAAVFWGLQAFELPYALFGGPGPGYRALTAVMYAFSLAFERGQTGYAAAVSVLFAGVAAALTLGLAGALRLGREEVTAG